MLSYKARLSRIDKNQLRVCFCDSDRYTTLAEWLAHGEHWGSNRMESIKHASIFNGRAICANGSMKIRFRFSTDFPNPSKKRRIEVVRNICTTESYVATLLPMEWNGPDD